MKTIFDKVNEFFDKQVITIERKSNTVVNNDFKKAVADKLSLYAEVMIDIAMNAAWLLKENKIDLQDSKELVEVIQNLAIKFEESYNPEWDDYIDRVDSFAVTEITKYYTSINQNFENHLKNQYNNNIGG